MRSTGTGAPQSVPASLLMMLKRDLTLSRTFSVCFLYVGDLSRVTPRYFGANSCTTTSPASVTFSFLAACCPGEIRSPLSSLLLGAVSSSQRTRSSVRYQERVHSQEKIFDCVARVQSSAYPNISDSVGGSSLMYTLKNDGASTGPWGRPFIFKIRFLLTW